jgi:hypothetical protein
MCAPSSNTVQSPAGLLLEFLGPPLLLNIDANKLATMELQEFGSIKPFVPSDQSCGI